MTHWVFAAAVALLAGISFAGIFASADSFPPGRFDELESPLRSVDKVLTQFAADHKIELTQNFKGWPERSLRWRKDGIDRLVQISLNDPNAKTFDFWICASQERGAVRYWKRENLKKNAAWREIGPEIGRLLAAGYGQVDSLSRADLVSANSNSRSGQ
jgi:hypothetical protein